MTYMTRHLSRRAALVAVGAYALLAASCSDFLVAENPGAVREQDLNDPAYIALISNGPIFAFQSAIDDVTYWNAQFTDEIYNQDVFVEEGQIDRRDMYPEMTYMTAFTYNPMQRARFVAEDAARRLKILIPADSANRFLPIARALALAGMSYVALGEMNCTTPIDLGVPKTSEDMFGDAITRFEEAITIAQAAKTFLQSQTPVNPNLVAATDSVRQLALVGAARAALNRGELARATGFANQVAAGFSFVEWYSDNTTAQHHRTYNRLTLGSSGTMRNTPFMAKTGDPRIPRISSTTTNLNGKPLSPTAYSTYSGTVAGAPFAAALSFRIASHLEAQYIIAEAAGPTAATSAFVDARRAVGLQTARNLPANDPNIMIELREQRSRDFYLDNHRLGDLRRYIKLYNVNLFEQGGYPGSTTGQVFHPTTFCWPLPISEINENPNIPKG